MDKNLLDHILQANHIPNCRYFSEIGSTNDEAIRWIGQGAEEYSIVIADSQTAGRGRNARKWVTTPSASIAMSMILFPNEEEQGKIGLFSLLVGASVREAIHSGYGIPAQIKWPNDVLINGEKTAGILTESVWNGNVLQGLVVGIGINLFQDSIPPRESLLFPATCIQDHTSKKVDPYQLIDGILKSLINSRKTLLTEYFRSMYLHNLAYRYKDVSLHIKSNQVETGKLVGIDEAGNLLLQSAAGNVQSFPIGDISLRLK